MIAGILNGFCVHGPEEHFVIRNADLVPGFPFPNRLPFLNHESGMQLNDYEIFVHHVFKVLVEVVHVRFRTVWLIPKMENQLKGTDRRSMLEWKNLSGFVDRHLPEIKHEHGILPVVHVKQGNWNGEWFKIRLFKFTRYTDVAGPKLFNSFGQTVDLDIICLRRLIKQY